MHATSMDKIIEVEMIVTHKDEKGMNRNGADLLRHNSPSEHQGRVCVVVLNLAVCQVHGHRFCSAQKSRAVGIGYELFYQWRIVEGSIAGGRLEFLVDTI